MLLLEDFPVGTYKETRAILSEEPLEDATEENPIAYVEIHPWERRNDSSVFFQVGYQGLEGTEAFNCVIVDRGEFLTAVLELFPELTVKSE